MLRIFDESKNFLLNPNPHTSETKHGDIALAAVSDNRMIGAVYVRIMIQTTADRYLQYHFTMNTKRHGIDEKTAV